MPICIILDPLDPLIHIEGGGGRARAGAPEGAAWRPARVARHVRALLAELQE